MKYNYRLEYETENEVKMSRPVVRCRSGSCSGQMTIPSRPAGVDPQVDWSKQSPENNPLGEWGLGQNNKQERERERERTNTAIALGLLILRYSEWAWTSQSQEWHPWSSSVEKETLPEGENPTMNYVELWPSYKSANKIKNISTNTATELTLPFMRTLVSNLGCFKSSLNTGNCSFTIPTPCI